MHDSSWRHQPSRSAQTRAPACRQCAQKCHEPSLCLKLPILQAAKLAMPRAGLQHNGMPCCMRYGCLQCGCLLLVGSASQSMHKCPANLSVSMSQCPFERQEIYAMPMVHSGERMQTFPPNRQPVARQLPRVHVQHPAGWQSGADSSTADNSWG